MRAFGPQKGAALCQSRTKHIATAIRDRPSRSHGETHHETRRVNLNTADQREIEDLPMVGARRAAELMRARPFKSWEAVAKVPGFSLRGSMTFGAGGAELG